MECYRGNHIIQIDGYVCKEIQAIKFCWIYDPNTGAVSHNRVNTCDPLLAQPLGPSIHKINC